METLCSNGCRLSLAQQQQGQRLALILSQLLRNWQQLLAEHPLREGLHYRLWLK